MSLIASCHCGATQIELAELPASIHACNCSFCSRSGAVWGYVDKADMQVRAQGPQTTYSASDAMNQHHFCSTCGMHIWGESPDWSSAYNTDGTPKDGFSADTVPTGRSYQINLKLIDDLDWSSIAYDTVDGRNNW